MTPTLHENKLVRTLETRSRKDTHASALFGILRPIVDDVTPLLEFIRHSFPGYPSHGIDHSFRILERIGGILSKAALSSLTTVELFCVVLATIFHDIGMVAPESAIPNDSEIRKAHHKRSAALFRRYLADRIPLMDNRRMADIVAFIIECHGLGWEEMQSRREFFEPEILDGQTVRPGVLAILLRIGDLLDLDSDRTSDICLKYCSSWYANSESIEHHNRHKCVRNFFYDDKKIAVRVECPTLQQYKIWFSWLEYLRMDILNANTYLFCESQSVFHLPLPLLDCTPTKTATFELWPLRFEIDESGALWDIISRSIYTGKHDYLRELVQNSIDAGLRRVYEHPDSEMAHPSPRNWHLSNYEPLVLVVISRRKAKVYVSDNGIGMNRRGIEEFLFRVAGSGMKKPGKSGLFRFPAIATFGIGFISVLTRASNLRLVTKHSPTPSQGSEGIEIQLDANLRDAIVQKATNADDGTSVILDVRDPQYVRGATEYLLSTFQYPSVSIHLIDWDLLDSAKVLAGDFLSEEDIALYERTESLLRARPGNIDAIFSGANRFFERARSVIESKVERGRSRLAYLGRPPLTIPARAPERLPTKSAWCLQLNYDSEIERSIRLPTKSKLDLEAAVLVVPVQFSDYALGVEWRSMHAFLVARRNLTQQIVFAITREFPSKTLVTTNPNLAVPEAYEEDLLDLFDDPGSPYDLIEMMERRRQERRKYEDPAAEGFSGPMLVSSRQTIKRYIEANFNSSGKWKEALNEDFFESYYEGDSDVLKVLAWFREQSQIVCQDGIRLPLVISDIAPIGTIAGVTNLLAEARLPYNVSRNAIDESEERLRPWRSNVSTVVLENIAREVKRTLDDANVIYAWKDLWTGPDGGMFGQLSYWMELSES